MESIIFLAPFIPVMAMIPPSVAAVWIASRWFKTRGTSAEIRAEVSALRQEIAQLHQVQADTHERLDFAERMLSQLREGRSELPKHS